MNILIACSGGGGRRTISPWIWQHGYIALAESIINDTLQLVKTVNPHPYVMFWNPGGFDNQNNMLLHQVADLAKINPNLANEYGMCVEMVARYATVVQYLGYGTPDNGKFDREYYKWAMYGVPHGTICIDGLGVKDVHHPDAEFVRTIQKDETQNREVWVEGGPQPQWGDFNCVLDAGDPGLWDFANRKARGKFVLQNDRSNVGMNINIPWHRNWNPTIRDLRALDRVGIKPFIQQQHITGAAIEEWKKP